MTRRDALLWMTAASQTQAAPKRLKRAQSFLGIHFDFHAGPDCKEVGKNTTPAMIDKIIDLVRPDYLQIDCKGHPGYSSYPTKVGNPVPGFVGGDPLRVWRDVTARRGVALYVHYSGVVDAYAAQRPGWAAMKADGKPHGEATSLFSRYVDELMIPQLREIADYGVDGIWVDGDCWGAIADYSELALRKFREETGIQDVPRKAGDPHWFEFLEFHRRAYRRYLRHFVTEVKRTHPSFQICSNWAFTDHMPEPVSVPVDFLSGDFTPQDSVSSARIAGRYLVHQGTPWDLMAWSFAIKPARAEKSAVQLQREAAVVLSLGGGFQAYFSQNRDASVKLEQMPVMAEVAKFCRARQALCHQAKPVPQIGLLFSTADHYRRQNGLFTRGHQQIQGILHALVDSQYSVELVSESHLRGGRMREYPLLVIPECEYLEPAFRNELSAYAKAGGKLLLIGSKAAAMFEEELSGNVVAMRSDFGRAYRQAPNEAARLPLQALVRQLFPDPMVEVTGDSARDVDVVVATKNGKLQVNLVNTSGPHRTEPILSSIAPVGPLTVSVRVPKRPKKVTLEPSGLLFEASYRDGKLSVTVPKVEIHEVLVLG
jgi:hypothetical protein